jgi:hypothetical protein
LRIRIDFGRVFPGLLILLVGLALFVVWLVLAVISFFLFFVPPLHGIFYFALNLLAASLVLMVAGILIALSGATGWWGGGHYTQERVRKDRMRVSERFGEFFGAFISFLVILYFFASQANGTGFFTSGFGPVEQMMFYGPMLFGIAVGIIRGAYGRKNAIRPLEVLRSAFLAISAFWLLLVFPFEFTHLTALVPLFIQLAFSWVSNPVGQLVLVLMGLGGLVSMFFNAVVYVSVRGQLTASPASRSSMP